MAVTKVVVSGASNVGGVKVNDTLVVKDQQTSDSFGTVAQASSTPTQAEVNAAIDAINAVVTALKAHGLIADAS